MVGVVAVNTFSPTEAELINQPFAGKNWQVKRYVGLGFGAVSLVLFQLWIFKRQPESGVWPTLVWATSLGWMLTVIFDLERSVFIVALVTVLWSGILTKISTKILTPVLILVVTVWAIYQVPVNWSQLRIDANKRLTDEFTTNGYQMGWPSKIKALAYNRYYFGLRQLYQPLVDNLDIERLIAPGQQGATVTRSLWGGKDLPSVYFGAMVLALLGLRHWGQMDRQIRLGVVILATMGMWEAAVALMAGFAFAKLPKFGQLAMGVVMLVGITSGYVHMVRDELTWRDNKPWVHEQMARAALEIKQDGPIVVTTLLGNSKAYYNWLAGQSSTQISFRHFDLTTEPSVQDTIYIGLPGEFVGKNDQNIIDVRQLPSILTLVKQIALRDSVSYGYGDAIWVVEAK